MGSKDLKTEALPTANAQNARSNESDDEFGPWSEPAWYNCLHSPFYGSSHRKLRNYVRTYVDQHVVPHCLEWEAAGDVPQEARLHWAKSGIAFADVPSPYRPPGCQTIGDTGLHPDDLDAFHTLIMTDETARIEGGVTACLGGGSVIGCPPIIHHGTEEQKRAWLPGLFSWDTSFCLGITEPTGGSDVGNIRTTAKRSEDGKYYIVNGLKKWITGAPWATHCSCAVRTSDGPGSAGISLLVVPLKGTPGVTITKIANSGQNAGGASWIRLEDVQVPVQNLIGSENAGFPLIMTNFNRERFIMSVGCNRKARTCLSHALAYAKDRETFGQPLVMNQLIRHKLTEMARKIEGHWAWLEQIAYHVQSSPKGWQDADVAGRIALAKVTGGKMLEFAAREAQQIFGGAGYQKGGTGASVEQISRDLRMMVVGGGSEEILGELAFREEVKLSRKKASRI